MHLKTTNIVCEMTAILSGGGMSQVKWYANFDCRAKDKDATFRYKGVFMVLPMSDDV